MSDEELQESPATEETGRDYEAEIAQLRRENAKHRIQKQEKESELQEFRAWKDAQKTEAQKLQERAERAEKELTTLRLDRLRAAVAKEAGLDPDLADRIRGESEDEMLEDAKSLAKKYGAKPSVDVYAGRRGVPVTAQSKDDPNRAFNDWVRNS